MIFSTPYNTNTNFFNMVFHSAVIWSNNLRKFINSEKDPFIRLYFNIYKYHYSTSSNLVHLEKKVNTYLI